MYRVCDGCSSGCRYVTVGEYNNQLAQTSSTTNQLKLLHINIRSLQKHINSISNLIFNDFDKSLDIICFSETKLEEPEPSDSNNPTEDLNFDIEQVQLPGYDFVHNPSKTNAGGTGI